LVEFLRRNERAVAALRLAERARRERDDLQIFGHPQMRDRLRQSVVAEREPAPVVLITDQRQRIADHVAVEKIGALERPVLVAIDCVPALAARRA
jgi:hypothetical protein